MIHEVATLNIKEGKQDKFEQAFIVASKYISSIKGYKGHSLRKCLEVKNKYILLVDWESLEDHEIGFRQSKEYLKWKQLLHHYYEPFPTVEHYETVFKNEIVSQ